jgi:hypothetical protein
MSQGLVVDNILGLHISVSIHNHYIFTWDLLFRIFSYAKDMHIYVFLLPHLRILRNLEYIRIYLMFAIAIYPITHFSERFQVHDIINNSTESYNFQQFLKYSLFECCHFSRYDMFASFVKHLQDVCK